MQKSRTCTEDSVEMDAKDLRIETALGERNDGSKYSQSGVALQCNRNKSYQDIGSNPVAKAEAPVRPCAVIGPDRVVPPPASNDAYLKKASVDLWPCPDNLYTRPPEYPHKLQVNVNPTRNISPRQTFQENMQRILVPPTYSAIKHADESNLNRPHDRNAALSKNTKQTMAPEAKYCDVPYALNLLTNEHKNVREMDMCVPSVNSPLTRTAPHGWLQSGVNLHAPRTYGAHEVYQYPQYPSCTGPRPPVMPVPRPHRTFQEEAGYVYPESYYQDSSVRFKPYPSVKEHNPQARYDYSSNYPNSFHPPPTYAQHKYDIPSTRPPHPYSVYPHLKYLDNRGSDPNIEGYQRPNQQSINYSMQFRNQVIHSTYAPPLGNTQSKLPSYPPDASVKLSNKLSFDNNKAFVDYENAKPKYSLPDSYFVNEMPRTHQVQKPLPMPNYASPGLHPVPVQQYHRKDNMALRTYEYMPHYRHFEHLIGLNATGHHPPQFSPSMLAISPTDSNTSNDTTQTQGTFHEDCGYVSQSSTTSARSVDSGIRLPNDYYRRYDYRYRPIIGNSHMLPKSNLNPNNSKENKQIDVRQFLSMWNEGDEDNASNIPKEVTDPKNYTRRHESAKSQDELYVLGLVNVPNEELAKYEHIQKVSKLPENIKGYSSIELLNQFEEVIESSKTNSFKSSSSKEFIPMKDRKNAIKQIVEVLPRPVSPLDVEAKISQSVIHKEVGCNFEIKPCSPKMLNVEIASPVKNILGERAIEKVSNPLLYKAKSPLSMRIDGNTACNKIQKQESTPYESSSCKMVGSPFTVTNMNSVKTNYTMQDLDLETSSGLCLASLPRLDNEIELNFPEVNQQFINANKGDRNLLEKYSQDVTENNVKTSANNNNDAVPDDSKKYKNVSLEEGSGKEPIKLSQFRKTKFNHLEYSEDESNANAIRTDSVIIENPENVRRFEEKISSMDEEENTPMNLTSQNSLYAENEYRIHSDITNSPKHETHAMDCALDFSLSKSENGLPIINCYDNEKVQTAQKDQSTHMVMGPTSCFNGGNHIDDIVENSKASSKLSSECVLSEINPTSIIVRNNRSAENDCEIKLKNDTLSIDEHNDGCFKTPEKSVKYFTNQIEPKLDNKRKDKIIDYKNKINSVDKGTLTNVIINQKHKNKNKHKTLKVKADIVTSSLDQELPHKTTKKSNVNENTLFEIDKSSHQNSDSKQCEHKPINSKSVIKNNDNHENVETAVSNISKDEVSETNSGINTHANHKIMVSESDQSVEKVNLFNDLSNFVTTSVDTEIVKDSSKITNRSTEVNGSDNLLILKCITENDGDINDNIRSDKPKDESNAQINQTNKYYNDLVSESNLFVEKTYCMSAENQSPEKTLVHEEDSNDIQIPSNSTEDNVDDTLKQKSVTKTINDINNDQDLANLNSGRSSTITREHAEFQECKIDVFQDKKCCNDDHKLYEEPLDIVVSNNSGEITSCFEEKVTDDSMSYYESTSRKNNSLINKKEIVTRSIASDVIEHPDAVVADDELSIDKKYSIDSGYQSNKNSFTENDESIIEIAVNSGEDSVFIEKESECDKFSLNQSCENDNKNEHILLPDSDSPVLTTPSSSLVIENNKYINLKINTELLPETTKSSNLYDSIDANMKILFEQPNNEILAKHKNIDDIVCDSNIEENKIYIQTKHEEKYKADVAEKAAQSNKLCVYEDLNKRTLLDALKEVNLNEEILSKINDGNVAMDSKIEDSDLYIQIKDEGGTNIGHCDARISVEDTNKMNIDEPCVRCLKEDKEDAEIHTALYAKRYSEYRGKELYSPRIQKLIVFNEGKIFKQQSSLNKTKHHSDNDGDSIIKIVTPDQIDSAVPSESEIEVIQDEDVDTECEMINSQRNTNNSLDSSNDESRLVSIVSMDSQNNNRENSVQINQSISIENGNKSEFETECLEDHDAHNDLVDIQDIVFSYPNNSIISEITDNILDANKSTLEFKCKSDNNEIEGKKIETNMNSSKINRCRSLKRSFSDSALTTHVSRDHIQDSGNLHYVWPPKRNRIGEFENFVPINRRNSLNFEENVSFCILIDDNCIITEETEEKICITELQEDYTTEIDTTNHDNNTDLLKDLYCSPHEINVDYTDSQVLECNDKSPVQESWVEDIACVETVFSDEVAENVVISAPSSPTDSASEYEQNGYYIYGSASCSHTDKVKSMHGDKMTDEDAKIVDTLYRTPHMDIMNKTLLYGDKHVESDDDQTNISLELDDWKGSPTHTPDYIDPTHASNDFRLETPENKENVFVKELSPLRRIDDYLDVSSADNENDEHIVHQHVPESDKTAQDRTVHSWESSLDNLFDYKLKSESISTTSTASTTSSFPEVSSTTSDEKNSSILLKITNLNGSRVSKINENETNKRPRCKFTEKKEYSSSNLNFPNRPLMTKAAQKYIPPIKESIRDLKVKITLPQQSLLKLKQLKLSRNETKAHKQLNIIPRIVKKPKPNFDDVLKSIDEIQIKRHKEKSKKAKTVVPKVVIKKNGNGSHYASTPKEDTFNPDLTGRKWQPWVFLEKNHFIDRMAIKNKTRAIYSHRKKTYVLKEKFKKYKSVGSTKFVISHPKTPGQLKYTFKLKHIL